MDRPSSSTLSPAPQEWVRLSKIFSCGCPDLDALYSLNDQESQGLKEGHLLQIAGVPGSGKTRTCLGFLLSALFQHEHVDVLVVDLEGSLTPQLISLAAHLYADYNDAQSMLPDIQEKIIYRRMLNTAQFIGFLRILPGWLENHPRVRLVIIDSLSTALRSTQLEYKTRNMLNDLIHATVAKITAKIKVSVVVTSQLISKAFESDGSRADYFDRNARALLVPVACLRTDLMESSLGKNSKSQSANVQNACLVMYYDRHGNRHASVFSATFPTLGATTPYTMDALGPCNEEFRS